MDMTVELYITQRTDPIISIKQPTHVCPWQWKRQRDRHSEYDDHSLINCRRCTAINPLTPTVAVWTQQSILCQTGLRRHLQFLTSRHSDSQSWASECPDVKNYKWPLNPVWHGMLCTHMATVGVKGLNTLVNITSRGFVRSCVVVGKK